jgi:predicted Fe-Mo cluster-binding NifX family protein
VTPRIAIPTNNKKGLQDEVADVFARAPTFTIIEFFDDEIKKVEVEINKAAKIKHGAGPIVSRELVQKNIDYIVAAELGPGATDFLKMEDVKIIKVHPKIKVNEAIEKILLNGLEQKPSL